MAQQRESPKDTVDLKGAKDQQGPIRDADGVILTKAFLDQEERWKEMETMQFFIYINSMSHQILGSSCGVTGSSRISRLS